MWRFLLLAVLFVRSDEKTGHLQHRSLSRSELQRLAEMTDYENFVSDILRPIMRVRQPGTRGHHKVKMVFQFMCLKNKYLGGLNAEFMKEQFENLNWMVTFDEFDANTPLGIKHFTNIIATLNPNAEECLVVSAHYESKLFAPVNGKYFVGATDSAVPCAMMIELARTLTPHFVRKQQQQETVPNVGLEMIFFDGEEAFKQWSAVDSLYGSRHLAELLENIHRSTGWTGTRKIPSIKSLILLDLIGAANPVFYDYFPQTSDLYKRLQFVERRLTASGNLGRHTRYFPGALAHSVELQDDHIPFLKRGVPILHLITNPFPPCWHRLCDDMEHLEHNSIHNLIKIFRVFLAEYFGLSLNNYNNYNIGTSSISGVL